MRKALIISLVVHVALGFAALRLVRISQVRFVPREVYAVQIVSLQETPKPKPQEMKAPPEEAPREQPKVEEPKKEELVAPTKKPKPEKKTPPAKTIPSTQIEPPQPEQPEEGDAEGVTTGDMALDVEDFPFAYYLTTVKRKVAANWQVPGTSREAVHCRVYFRITRSGAIESPAVETSSGNFLFDQAALRAVVQANPLPPLPGGFGDEYLGVHFSFAYENE
jgi:TonB family protein